MYLYGRNMPTKGKGSSETTNEDTDFLVHQKLEELSVSKSKSMAETNDKIAHNSKEQGDNDNDVDVDEVIDEDMIIPGIKFVNYKDESQMDSVMKLVGRDLSEPYSIFTYRYFLQRFPELCIFAYATNDDENDNDINNDLSITTSKPKEPIGCIVCKIDPDDEDDTDPNMNMEMNQLYQDEYQQPKLCGYIGMLAVDTSRRRSGIGSALVKRAVRRMETMGCSSVILETEVSNQAAMKLYEERLGFMREEFLVRYYLNNGDAYRLKLWLK